MRQFDVFEARQRFLYCVLQNDLLDPLQTVMVAPLVPTNAKSLSKLTPAFEIAGRRYLLDVSQQVSVRAVNLRSNTPLTSLVNHRDDILNAINLLYWGI